jgi:large subunit ribosomal protein L24
MKIRKDDTVLIISGKDRGRKGKVLQSLPKTGKVLVEGINIRKKSVRPKKSGEKGQIVEMPGFLDISNVKIICPKCNKATRIEFKINKDKKIKNRICKKCDEEI